VTSLWACQAPRPDPWWQPHTVGRYRRQAPGAAGRSPRGPLAAHSVAHV